MSKCRAEHLSSSENCHFSFQNGNKNSLIKLCLKIQTEWYKIILWETFAYVSFNLFSGISKIDKRELIRFFYRLMRFHVAKESMSN